MLYPHRGLPFRLYFSLHSLPIMALLWFLFPFQLPQRREDVNVVQRKITNRIHSCLYPVSPFLCLVFPFILLSASLSSTSSLT
ncbi:MAG: hypothetical protein JOS17DRAFT_448775 [Linnemannia elongata]|nr:MAG: hypothetical protein JOS17DRAFT_448775 [Linnemannia elongata]